ncbi:hypothetical protein [Sulfitobacter geojensis]|uniref:Uncharacterized protein n=1 Tax=Sulfitobacter geojensis TaxID=1342299 RepID=A0AAE2W2U8_9RHOB|nr:hypothetical protein [Sulfitobacter geojensis]MBM1690686.1 hypothetical protein [Sulfitobacter geojensis]MBM1694752.1 hypothetical protein [Sulfitobacter geojensis]MBM1707542.1 hypothetical protein [Sulfitobacter geojensis]MBM1711152.1 hypothetical protein [Sulfitobacter geojensis]MBM1715667.1 hypothetical protein [Sulfitobacter geojensis]
MALDVNHGDGSTVTRFEDPRRSTTVSVGPELAFVLDKRCAQLNVSRAEYIGNLVVEEVAPRVPELKAKTYEQLWEILGALTPDRLIVGCYRAPDPRADFQPGIFVRVLAGSSMAILDCQDLQKFTEDLRAIARNGGRTELKSIPKGFATLHARRQGSGIIIELESDGRVRQKCSTMAARNVELTARLFDCAVALARMTKEQCLEPL